MIQFRMKLIQSIVLVAVIAISIVGIFTTRVDAQQSASAAAKPSSRSYPTLYKTIRVENLDIFYREAGPSGAPTIL